MRERITFPGATAMLTRVPRAAATVVLTAGLYSAGSMLTVTPALAVGSYNNAEIATRALRYVGQWGGDACRDAHKPGDSGGQCRAFVNCVVWMVSGHTQNLGGRDYYQPFLTAGGVRITSIGQLAEGDVVQVGEGVHTFIIVRKLSVNAGTGKFTVVDSNHAYNERVMTYNRTFSLSSTTRGYRMGSTGHTIEAPSPSPPPPGPPPPAASGPPVTISPSPIETPPAPTYSEQEGHYGVNTFTDPYNASGEGPRIAPAQVVQVACKVYAPQIQSANPDGYWYRIASSPWNNSYYSPANTFMNGDRWGGPYTHNTDFAVPDC
jgi:hypothetical protein